MDNKENKEKIKEEEEEKDVFVEIPNNFNRLDVNFKSDKENENEYFEFELIELLYGMNIRIFQFKRRNNIQ